MPEGVSVHYRWTLAEATEATQWHLRQSRRRGIFVFCGAVAVLTGGWAAYQSAHGGDGDHVWWVFAAAVYFLCLLFLRRFLIMRRVRRNYARSASQDVEMQWLITGASLQVNSVHSTADIKWQAFNKAVSTPAGLLLYPQPILYHWLPRHGFADAEGYEAVIAWARQNIPAFRELRR